MTLPKRLLVLSSGLLLTTTALARPPAGAGLAAMDTDQNQIITQAEWEQAHQAKFARIDSNADGYIEASERAEFRQQLQERMRREARNRVIQADTDGDQRISRAEFDTAGNNKFRQLDLNEDGEVTMDEARSYAQSRRQNRSGG